MLVRTGERIQQILNRRGISQRALGRALKVSPGTVNKYITGVSQIDADYLPIIAEALGVDTCEIVAVRDQEPAPRTISDVAVKLLIESWDRLPESERVLIDGLVAARTKPVDIRR